MFLLGMLIPDLDPENGGNLAKNRSHSTISARFVELLHTTSRHRFFPDLLNNLTAVRSVVGQASNS